MKQQKLIWLIIGLAIIALSVFAGCGKNSNGLRPSGTLEATEVSISPLLSGRVLELRKQEGDEVKVGDTLVVLDTELLGLQRNQSEAQLSELAAAYEALQAQKTQCELQIKNYSDKLSRQTTLLEKGSSSRQIVDDLTSQRDIAQSQLKAIAAQSSANVAQRSRIEAGKKMIERQLRDGVIVSPLKGTVLVKGSEPGESVTPQTIVYKLSDLTNLTVKIYLTEPEMGKVKIGQKVVLRVDALDKKIFEGVVSFINPTAEFTPKNIQTKKTRADLVFAVKLNVANPSGELHGGMPIEAEL